MQYFLDVVLPIPLAKPFTYEISEEQAEFIEIGMRVVVPFGKRKLYTGIAFKIHQTSPEVYEAKPIDQILDETSTINQIQLKHWQWIAEYYMCTLGEVIRAALPKAFLLESETVVYANKDVEFDENELSDEEFLVFEALENQSSLSISDIIAIVERKNVMPLLNELISKGVILVKEKVYDEYKPKIVRHVKLAEDFADEIKLQELLEELSRAPKQREVIMHLFQLQSTTKPIKISELVEKSGCSSSIVKALIGKGILEEIKLRLDRVGQEVSSGVLNSFELTPHQTQALKSVQRSFKENKPALLFGVTSSGKTEVYLKLIEEAIEEDKQVLYLLPEIALTSQLIIRLQNYFEDCVSVYHSKYSVNERVEVWNNVNSNKKKAQIVIGARSALFLPFSDLGLIIIDEEHEASFKQFDPAPRYHARDSAMVLAKFHNANCLLGSATPSLESYKNAKENKYGFAQMTERYGKVLLPDIQLVDIKEATRKKRMKGHFSEKLFLKIEEKLLEKEQIILFRTVGGFLRL